MEKVNKYLQAKSDEFLYREWLKMQFGDVEIKNIHVSKDEAFQLYNLKQIIYPDLSSDFYVYHSTICRRKDGYEPVKIDKSKIPKTNIKKETLSSGTNNVSRNIRRDSLTRSSQTLYQLAKCNASEFKSFVTLTFKDNVSDIAEANEKFKIWRKMFQRTCKQNGIDFKYLGVPEFQKRGAVHYHLLTNVEVGSYMIPHQDGEGNMYDVRHWNNGFASVFDLTQTDDMFNLTAYIAKYFWKDIDNRLFGHQKILHSNNLSKPIVRFEKLDDVREFINSFDHSEICIKYIYENMTIIKT